MYKTDDTLWQDLDLVSFDTETTGKYPIGAEVCELAAVKWRGGNVVDTFQTLLKPSRPMDEFVISIHGITNEMVSGAPRMPEKIGEFHQFIQGAVTLAHHAPFDLGFLALDFEMNGLALPIEPVICTSLLSRNLFPESENHRLQTLVKFFGIDGGNAHRALDDARACLEVGLRCLQRLGSVPIARAFEAQGHKISWQRFSMRELEGHSRFKELIDASRQRRPVEMVYGASRPRQVQPCGLVRSLDGDFMAAVEEGERREKRFFLEKVKAVQGILL